MLPSDDSDGKIEISWSGLGWARGSDNTLYPTCLLGQVSDKSNTFGMHSIDRYGIGHFLNPAQSYLEFCWCLLVATIPDSS